MTEEMIMLYKWALKFELRLNHYYEYMRTRRRNRYEKLVESGYTPSIVTLTYNRDTKLKSYVRGVRDE